MSGGGEEQHVLSLLNEVETRCINLPAFRRQKDAAYERREI